MNSNLAPSENDRMIDFAVRTADQFVTLELNGPSFAQWVASVSDDDDFHQSQFAIRGGGNAVCSISASLAAHSGHARRDDKCIDFGGRKEFEKTRHEVVDAV